MADIQAEDIFQGVLVMFRDDIGMDNMGFCLGLLPGLVIIMEAFLGCLFVGTFHEVSIMVKIQPRFLAESCCRSFWILL